MIGYIYKIYDNTNGNIYYGSTKESVSRRMTKHRNNYKRYIIEGKGNYTKSFDIFRNMDYSYSVVEKVEFNDKYELKTKERFYIENNECINKEIPNRTMKEYNQDKKEHYKEWREKNKDRISEKRKKKGKCPNCDKEMRLNNIPRHIKKACKKI